MLGKNRAMAVSTHGSCVERSGFESACVPQGRKFLSNPRPDLRLDFEHYWCYVKLYTSDLPAAVGRRDTGSYDDAAFQKTAGGISGLHREAEKVKPENK